MLKLKRCWWIRNDPRLLFTRAFPLEGIAFNSRPLLSRSCYAESLWSYFVAPRAASLHHSPPNGRKFSTTYCRRSYQLEQDCRRTRARIGDGFIECSGKEAAKNQLRFLRTIGERIGSKSGKRGRQFKRMQRQDLLRKKSWGSMIECLSRRGNCFNKSRLMHCERLYGGECGEKHKSDEAYPFPPSDLRRAQTSAVPPPTKYSSL